MMDTPLGLRASLSSNQGGFDVSKHLSRKLQFTEAAAQNQLALQASVTDVMALAKARHIPSDLAHSAEPRAIGGLDLSATSASIGPATSASSVGATLAATALPDLVIDDVEIAGVGVSAGATSGVVFHPGDEVSLEWNVDNNGAGDAAQSRAGLYFRGERVDYNTTNELSGGESDNNETDSFTIPTDLAPGTYNVMIYADYRNDVPGESNEFNNGYSFFITVAAPLPPTFTIGNAGTVTEGGNAVFTVTMSGTITAPVTVWYSTLSGTAKAADGDYAGTFVDKPLTFNPGGSKTQTISIPILVEPNNPAEAAESFKVGLQHTETGSAFTTGSATIAANGGSVTPTFTISDAGTVTEGGNAVFTVTMSGTIAAPVTVWYSTLEGTAKAADGDYAGTYVDKPITFNPGGSKTQTISIPILVEANNPSEAAESFKVGLQHTETGSAFTTGTATIAANGGSATPTFTISDAGTVTEGGNAVFTVTMSGTITAPVTVWYSTLSGTAKAADGDYAGTFVDKALTFNPGGSKTQTISIPILVEANNPPEAAESFKVGLQHTETGSAFTTGSATIAANGGAQPVADDYRDEDTDASSPLGSISLLAPVRTGVIGPADSNDLKGDKDVFKVTLTQGQTYVFTMTGATVNGFSPLSESIFTIRKAGSFSTIQATSTEGSNAVMEFYAETGGDYYIRTGSGGPTYTTDQAGYRLEMVASKEATPPEPGSTTNTAFIAALAAGPYVYSGVVGSGDPSDLFEVTAPATGGELSVRLIDLAVDIDLRITNGVGGTVAGPSKSSGTEEELLTTQLSPGQTVYINVYAGTSSPGKYTVDIRLTPNTPPDPVSSVKFNPGDHLFRTLADFAAGAYANQQGTDARTRLVEDGWVFYKSENVSGTPLSGIPWNGIFYENDNAQAVVAKFGNTLTISFRGTENGLDGVFDRLNWFSMDQHYKELGLLIDALDRLIREDPTITKVYVTGHSLGAAMVDLFMSSHLKTWDDGLNRTVEFQAITFAHPDIFNINVLFPSLSSVTDDRIVSFHNSNDIINVVDQPRGRNPIIRNSIEYSQDIETFDSHSMGLYLHGVSFLGVSGVGDNLIGLGLSGPGHNDFLVPGPTEGINNDLVSRTGSLLMVGGAGNDTYSVVPDSRRPGDTVIDSSGSDALWLRTAPGVNGGSLGWFQGTVRLTVSSNGLDLLIHPFQLGMFPIELPAIRIYRYFADSGRVEWIQWGDKLIQLPATAADVARWNGTYFNLISGSDIQYNERPDGTIFPLVSARGGPALNDTSSFESLKGSVSADINAGYALFREGLSPGGGDFSISADTTSPRPRDVRVDLTDIENLIGSDEDDTLFGSAVANTLVGRSGDDQLSGRQGNDFLQGGEGNDLIEGGADNDWLEGGSGADRLVGGPGDDIYFIDEGDMVTEAAGAGSDEVRTSLADTTAPANVDNLTGLLDTGQTLRGNALNNLITAGAGADRMVGGLGNDIYIVGAGDIVIEKLNEGTDEVRTTLAAYTLTADVEKLTGLSAAGQALTGNSLANFNAGGARNDVLNGGLGGDQMAGGLGNDIYFVDGGDVVTEGADGGTDEVRTTFVDTTAAANVEVITGLLDTGQTLRGNSLHNLISGGAGADRFVGGLGNDIYLVGTGDNVLEKLNEGVDEVRTALAVYTLTADVERLTGTSATGQALSGNALANVILAGVGNDALNGGLGADQMAGGLGNDVYFVDGGDVVTGGANAGTDEIRTSLSDTTASANVENITGLLNTGQTLRGNALNNGFAGGSGADRFVGGLGNDVYLVGSGDIVVEKPGEGTDEVRTALAAYALTADVERLTGISAAGQALTGNALANIITGGAGNDVIDGGAGVDQMAGGLGNDVYFVRDPGDSITDTGGIDEIRTALSDTTAGAGIENITGLLATGQTLRGNALANVIAGGTGADRMVGGLGDDIYLAGAGDNVIESAGGGTDEVRTGLAAYTLGAEVERLTGTSAAEQALTGNALANLIVGGAGIDRLTGGGGADVFRYLAVTESNSLGRDHILDFTPGTDKIDLGAIDASRGLGGDQAFAWIGSNAFGNVAGQLRATQSGAQWIVEGDVNGDGFADLVIALTLQGPTQLGAGDFVL
jgi:Ca2+-binding RTX toxin-like protein